MADGDQNSSPETDARLDRLLAGWARERGLSSAQTEDLRRAVLAAPDPDVASRVDMGPGWWRDLLDPLVAALSPADMPLGTPPGAATFENVGARSPGRGVGYRAYLRPAGVRP